MIAAPSYECIACHKTQQAGYSECVTCGGIVTLQVGGLTTPRVASLDGAPPAASNISELPRMFGKPDEAIRKLLNDVVALNESGQVDSLVIVTTNYGHKLELRKRIGHTGNTIVGGLMRAAMVVSAGAVETPIEDGAS